MGRRAKIFFFIPSFGGGGAERQCVLLINALAKRPDMDVALIHLHEGVNYGLVDRESVRTIRLRSGSNYDPRNILAARRLFDLEKPDIVFSWLHACDVFAWASRAIGSRFTWVMAERNSRYPSDPRFWIRNAVGRYADMIVSNSHQGDRYWSKRGVNQIRRAVVGNLLSEEWFATDDARPRKDLICFAGRFEPQKNVTFLTEAFVTLCDQRPDLRCVIIGEGSLANEVKTSAARAAAGAISVIPFQSGIRSYFERTSVFVNVSSHEGMPNTVIENLALGNRVVLSRIPEHLELVGEDYPFLIELGATPKDLAGLIERAFDTPVSNAEINTMRTLVEPMRAVQIAERYAQLFCALVGSGNA